MEKTTVAILPFPLTPAALFGYGILRFLGQISDKTHTRLAPVLKPPTEVFSCGGMVVDLRVNEKHLYPEIRTLIGLNPPLQRILSFGSFERMGEKESGPRSVLKALLVKLFRENSRGALSSIPNVVDKLLHANIDTRRSDAEIRSLLTSLGTGHMVDQTSERKYQPDQRIVHLPKYKSGGQQGHKSANDAEEFFRVCLREGRICSLENRHIGIVIGGPPNSGKSSLAASLVSEMQSCIESLQTRAAFANLNVSVGLHALDMGTPTTEAIAGGWGQDRERLQRLKKPWNMNLAKRTQDRFISSRGRCNITVSDLPGRIDNITKLLLAPADASIIIGNGNDWDNTQEDWLPFMQEFGVPTISKIRSNEGLPSLVSSWRPGERFNGRIIALSRTQKTWDRFIEWLALFLLFDILPEQFGERENTNI